MGKVYKKHQHQPTELPRPAFECSKCGLWSFKLRDMSESVDGNCKKCGAGNSVKRITKKAPE